MTNSNRILLIDI